MAVTVTLYDATTNNFARVGEGGFQDFVNLILLDNDAAALFDATSVDADAMIAAHEVSGNGWTTGGVAVANLATVQVGNDSKLTADTVSVTASGGSIVAKAAILAEFPDPEVRPIAFIDFGGTKTATAGNAFAVSWPSGIITWTYTP
jgi:hypothetical protein